MSLDLDQPFDEPFFTPGGPDVDDYNLPVSIDGRSFQLDTASQDFQRKSIKLLNTQQAQTGQDYAIEPPTIWRRSTESWHSGGDQVRFDRADSIDTRFRRSVGINPWVKYGIELLPDTTLLQAATAGQQVHLCSILDALYVAAGNVVTQYPNITTAPTTHTLAAPHVAITSDGDSVYVLCNNGVVEKRDSAGTWTTFYTEPSLNAAKAMLVFVKNYLLLGNGNGLKNILSGAAVTVGTQTVPSGWWVDATDGLSSIYVIGGVGDRWNIYRVDLDKTQASGLAAPTVAATLPDGEVAYSLASYMGYVLIGTNTGWRFAIPDSQNNLTYGQLIETPAPVLCFEGQGRFVWFGLSELAVVTPQQGGDVAVEPFVIYTEKAGLGRADLSVFVAPNTPAAASDVMSPGIGTVRSVVSVGGVFDGLGKRVFSVDGVGVYVQADNLVPSGFLDQGVYTFNSTDQKMGLYAQVFHRPLVGTVQIEASVDGDPTVVLGHNDVQGTTSLGNMPFTEAFDTIEMRYRLYRSATAPTTGPRVMRSEFRALDISGRATEWHIPLLLFENTNWDDTPRTRDVVGDYDFLLSLIHSRRQFTYREGDRTWDLHGTDFVWQPDHLTSDRTTYQGTFVLIAREIT